MLFPRKLMYSEVISEYAKKKKRKKKVFGVWEKKWSLELTITDSPFNVVVCLQVLHLSLYMCVVAWKYWFQFKIELNRWNKIWDFDFNTWIHVVYIFALSVLFTTHQYTKYPQISYTHGQFDFIKDCTLICSSEHVY